MVDGIVRTGLHRPLEDAADAILHAQLSGIARHSEKSDILTPWKEYARRRCEVYVTGGVPDASLRRGVFSRSANVSAPHLNSVEAQIPRRFAQGSGSGPDVWDNE